MLSATLSWLLSIITYRMLSTQILQIPNQNVIQGIHVPQGTGFPGQLDV